MQTLTYQNYLEAEKTQQLTHIFQMQSILPPKLYTVTAFFCHLVSLVHLLSVNILVPEAPLPCVLCIMLPSSH